jgi:tRNA-dihydrouridine synthase
MFNAQAARAMIGGVRRSVKGRLSVKLRLGVDENFERLAVFCLMLQDEGVEALTLHPRTSLEKLRRRARWEYVARLRAELKIPVTGNGDVSSSAELLARAESPCDGVMVGRAAIRKPWIFAAAAGLLPVGRIDAEAVAMRFLDLLAKRQPPEFWETRARRFFFYFCDNLKWAHHVRTLLGRETELGAMGAVLRSHFEANPEERWVAP